MKTVSRRHALTLLAAGAAQLPWLVACSRLPGEKQEASPLMSAKSLAGVEPGTILLDRPLAGGIRRESEGPWTNRLLLATSPDGFTWQRTGIGLTNHADVPCLITGPDGAVHAYFVAFWEGAHNKIVRASSTDLAGWMAQPVTVSGTAGWSEPVDPTVVLADDGRFRLYFTASAPGAPRPTTYSAISSDGLAFEVEAGPRYVDEAEVLDPSVLRIPEGWALFAGGGGAIGKPNYAAFSTDGLTFEAVSVPDTQGFILANGVATSGGYRYYAFAHKQRGGASSVRSLFSADGRSWALEDGFRLEPEASAALEWNGVKDPAVTRLQDGTYLMVYVSGIPGLAKGNRV